MRKVWNIVRIPFEHATAKSNFRSESLGKYTVEQRADSVSQESEIMQWGQSKISRIIAEAPKTRIDAESFSIPCIFLDNMYKKSKALFRPSVEKNRSSSSDKETRIK